MSYIVNMNCGFTYFIRDKSDKSLVYYGSSGMPVLDDRIKSHIKNYNYWKNGGKTNYCYSYKVLELNNYECGIIDVVFFTIKWELWERERLLIENNECVNKQVPNRTSKEYHADYYQNNKEQKAEYYQANKEYFKEQRVYYYQANKEQSNEKSKQYYQDNKDKIKEKQREKFNCPCGGKYTYRHKAIHIKSQKHQNWISSQSSISNINSSKLS